MSGFGDNCLPFATPTPTPTPILTPTPTPTPMPILTPTPTASGSAAPTPTPFPAGTLTLSPIADTHVRKDHQTSNYGKLTTLQVDGSPEKIIYMKFDLGSIAGRAVTKAILQLKVVDSSSATQYLKTSSSGWDETTINYSNRPILGNVVSTVNGGKSGNWISIDVTSFVNNNRGLIVTLGMDSIASNGLDFSSKEASSDRPQLIVNIQ